MFPKMSIYVEFYYGLIVHPGAYAPGAKTLPLIVDCHKNILTSFFFSEGENYTTVSTRGRKKFFIKAVRQCVVQVPLG